MAATTLTFGISGMTSGYIESIEVSKKMTEKMIIDKDGTFAQSYAFDPVFDISIRARGETDIEAADLSISGLTLSTYGIGIVVVTSVRTSERADDFPSFDISAQGWTSDAAMAP
jgi:hypothetical protein